MTTQSCYQTGLHFLLSLVWRLCQKLLFRICIFKRETQPQSFWGGEDCRRYSQLLLLQVDSSEQVSKMAALSQRSDWASEQNQDCWDSHSGSICPSWNQTTDSRSSRVRINYIGLNEWIKEIHCGYLFWILMALFSMFYLYGYTRKPDFFLLKLPLIHNLVDYEFVNWYQPFFFKLFYTKPNEWKSVLIVKSEFRKHKVIFF